MRAAPLGQFVRPQTVFTCRACNKRREAWRARDNRAIYGHLCLGCFENLPVSHRQHYVSVSMKE